MLKMAVSTSKRYVILDTICWEPIYLENLNIDKVKAYLKENLMPVDTKYSEQDLLHDIQKGVNVFVLPDGIQDETRQYIEEMIGEIY
jgi:hypothetical protein